VAPLAAAKRSVRGGTPTDIVVGSDAAAAISRALQSIGEPSAAGFADDEISDSLIVGDVGRMICGLQVWQSATLAPNVAEVWVRNTVEGGHRLRWKADTRMVIADT